MALKRKSGYIASFPREMNYYIVEFPGEMWLYSSLSGGKYGYIVRFPGGRLAREKSYSTTPVS